jgi:hypothetical protein
MKGVEIANIVGITVRTDQRIVKQFKEDGNFKSHTSRGRPKLLSKRDVRNTILFSRSSITYWDHQCMPYANEYYDYLSYFAWQWHLQPNCNQKPFLRTQHMSRQLDFVRQYRGWCIADWKCACWTNESTFEIGKILDKFIFGDRHMSDTHTRRKPSPN